MTSSSRSIAPESASPSRRLNPADMNTRGADVLASLIVFFRPTTPNADITHLCASVEGQQLLKTLGDFINLVADSEGNSATDAQEVMDIPVNNMDLSPSLNEMSPDELISRSTEQFLLLSQQVNENALPTKLVEEVRKIVFNSMPIRMISFDSTGGSCTLVDRNTLVDIILSRIHAAYPERRNPRSHTDTSWNALVRLITRFCRYAILSHTWLRGIPGDVLFHDWASRHLPRNTRGNSKIDNFCTIAARDYGVQLAWMDTVCINKESSSELDESIRSMYKWYKTAHVCIAYLADTLEFAEIPNDTWFTRGWTLQELVASRNIHFYNRDWTELQAPDNFDAHLSDPGFVWGEGRSTSVTSTVLSLQMEYQICKATTLTPSELYCLYFFPDQFPICRIMELAAMRTVTRAEDHVYSLMGLLDTSISIAYGEGPKQALRRMIQQIMISKKDFRSLFNHNNTASVLPSQITDYIGRSQTVDFPYYPTIPISLSHLGVHGTFLAIPLFNKDAFDLPPNICMSSMLLPNEYPIGTPSTYIALNDSTDTLEWISNLKVTVTPDTQRSYKGYPLIFVALLMSDVDPARDTFALISGGNLCVPVESDLSKYGHDTITVPFTDINPSNPYTSEVFGPTAIELQYQEASPHYTRELRFTRQEAKRLGWRVISSYFR